MRHAGLLMCFVLLSVMFVMGMMLWEIFHLHLRDRREQQNRDKNNIHLNNRV